MTGTTRIAVFGDLHGRVLLSFWLVKVWQEEQRLEIDYALSVGDVGVYREFEHMDKPSRKFASRYPEELGFSKFFWNTDSRHPYNKKTKSKRPSLVPKQKRPVKLYTHPIAEEVLSQVRCSLYFVRGNHEDHQYIKHVRENYARDKSEPVAVDYDWIGCEKGIYDEKDFCGYKRILCLPEGSVVRLPGVPVGDRKNYRDINLRAVNGIDRYSDHNAWEAPIPGTVDLLITHEAPYSRLDDYGITGSGGHYGSKKLDEFIKSLAPHWHFFGHHHHYHPAAIIKSSTGTGIHSVGLSNLDFEGAGSRINQGAFGVLSVHHKDSDTEKEFEFKIVDDEWYKNLNYTDAARFM